MTTPLALLISFGVLCILAGTLAGLWHEKRLLKHWPAAICIVGTLALIPFTLNLMAHPHVHEPKQLGFLGESHLVPDMRNGQIKAVYGLGETYDSTAGIGAQWVVHMKSGAWLQTFIPDPIASTVGAAFLADSHVTLLDTIPPWVQNEANGPPADMRWALWWAIALAVGAFGVVALVKSWDLIWVPPSRDFDGWLAELVATHHDRSPDSD